jgi:putative SOS response-associated peptidase YedK
MCGRFVSASPPDQIARYFDAVPEGERVLEPSYNVAPTNDVYAVLTHGGVRRLDTLHWGLVPFWAKDPSVGNRMINARAESLADKPAYRSAFRKRRCIIPADGFYEWKSVPGQKKKQPMYLHRADGEPLAFAGLWEVWRPKVEGSAEGPDGPVEELHSCTIITGEPNEKVAEVHDRMPVILPPSAWDEWLDPDVQDVDLLGRFLVPAPAALIDLYAVSTEVNNVRNKGSHLLDPAPVEPDDGASSP